MKIITTFCRSLLITLLLGIGLGGKSYAQQEESFDFNQFLQELEEAMSKIDEEEKGTGTEQIKPPAAEKETSPIALPQEEKTIVQKPVAEKRDPQSLFRDPAIQTITEKGSKRTEPTKESLNAYSTIMDDFVGHLSSIQRKTNSPQFSPEFKEKFSQYNKLIENIAIYNDQIKSHKAYKKLFLLPPESNKQLVNDLKNLRKKIIDFSGKIKTLDAQITIDAESEEKENKESLLRKLAAASEQQPIAQPAPITPVPTKQNVSPKQSIPQTPTQATKTDDESELK